MMSTAGDSKPPSGRTRWSNSRQAVTTHHVAIRGAIATTQTLIQSGQTPTP